MIEAKNIIVDNNLISLEYKYNDDGFYKLTYDIKKEEVIETEDVDFESKDVFIYRHLIIPLLKQIEGGKVDKTFFSMWN